MRPIFTIHAGEYLVASHIESTFKGLNVWVPSKDTGVDLLVTDKTNKKTVSLQVKFSKDFLIQNSTAYLRENLAAWGWWSLNPEKMEKSVADLWVFTLMSIHSKKIQYVILPPKTLHEFLTSIHGKMKVWQTYLMITKKGQCWETRGLSKDEQIQIAKHDYSNPDRNLSQYVNYWQGISSLA